MYRKCFLSAVVAVFFVSSIALAAPPTTWLELSQIVGTGEQIHIYRLPTRDVNGKIRYYDLTINFPVKDTGRIAANLPAASVKSPNIKSNQFVPGVYVTETSDATSCRVTTSILNSGRTQVLFHAEDKDGQAITVNWVTGPIDGHPLEQELLNAQIDQVPNYQDYSWGKVDLAEGGWWWDLFNKGDIVSAIQTGNIIKLSKYGSDKWIDGGITMIK